MVLFAHHLQELVFAHVVTQVMGLQQGSLVLVLVHSDGVQSLQQVGCFDYVVVQDVVVLEDETEVFLLEVALLVIGLDFLEFLDEEVVDVLGLVNDQLGDQLIEKSVDLMFLQVSLRLVQLGVLRLVDAAHII